MLNWQLSRMSRRPSKKRRRRSQSVMLAGSERQKDADRLQKLEVRSKIVEAEQYKILEGKSAHWYLTYQRKHRR